MDRREFLKNAAALATFGPMMKLVGEDRIGAVKPGEEQIPQVTRRP